MTIPAVPSAARSPLRFDTEQGIRAFRAARVLCVGDVMLDHFVYGSVDRISPEAPIPVLRVERETKTLGGAGNVLRNLRALGAQAALVSVVGDDDEAARLTDALERAGVGAGRLIRSSDRETLTKQRILADGQMLVRLDSGSTGPIDASTEDDLIDRLAEAHREVEAVIVSDYDYGVVTPRVVAALRELQESRPLPLLVDARDASRYRRLRPTAVKPNYSEAVRLLGEREVRGTEARLRQVGSQGERLLELTGARIVDAAEARP
jgi:D-beta-D-heptose 7-phosphate kinase/D-beta-D-heptose 1-phosphate adenosyltransferase